MHLDETERNPRRKPVGEDRYDSMRSREYYDTYAGRRCTKDRVDGYDSIRSTIEYDDDGYLASTEQRMPRRENNFNEREIMGSYRSQDSSRRRRHERQEHVQAARPWEEPHSIHPKESDERVVVTETFVHRPRKLSQVQEHTQPDCINSPNLDARRPVKEFVAEKDASSYYHDDWSRDPQPEPKREHHRLVPRRHLSEKGSVEHIRRAGKFLDAHSLRDVANMII